MDGNRRYAKRKLLEEGAGHDVGAMALLNMIIYCHELGVKYITAYAFAIDNFRRKPSEVQKIMDLLKECMTVLAKIAKHHPIKVNFAGNLELLNTELRDEARNLMGATAKYSKFVVTICVCYCCTDDIVHSVEESCREKHYYHCYIGDSHDDDKDDERPIIKLVDIEKNMYMAVIPDPDILIRTSDEHRLSNFLQWQTCHSLLASLSTDWPEIGVWHLVKVVLDFQQNYDYFVRKRSLA
ncbi:dehydrodolichyl diphosphate synthase 6-like [Gossypium australe]|uniref:Alkyl transferase n=1 Tax=Gossypium australe TaxID=47621 RepID=A0A5B6V3H0_9ROSI|nr:dehydrodolichyl diphosphate synthase 6-like [Gossypium australe]